MDLDNTVSISKCESYELESVRKSVKSAVEQLGGFEKFVKPKSRVLLKPNLLMPADIEKTVTTNPFVVQSVVELLQELDCKVIIADSPGGPYNKTILKKAYQKSGLKKVAEETGCELNYDFSSKFIEYHEGRHLKGFEIISPYIESDFFINLPKLKTHSLTYLTGAVKNCYGLIPGLTKSGYHTRFTTTQSFSEILIDLCELVKPSLNIMDGIIGMEGNGPNAGTPRKVGAIFAARNPYSMDYVCADIIGLDVDRIFTCTKSFELGLTEKLENIEIIGEAPERIKFSPPDAMSGILGKIPPSLLRFVGNQTSLFPHPNDTCIGCGKCAEICGKKAIKIIDKKALVDYKKCIRCYCCHEICPAHAIDLERPFLSRLIKRNK